MGDVTGRWVFASTQTVDTEPGVRESGTETSISVRPLNVSRRTTWYLPSVRLGRISHVGSARTPVNASVTSRACDQVRLPYPTSMAWAVTVALPAGGITKLTS